jgi:hypothetical protein
VRTAILRKLRTRERKVVVRKPFTHGRGTEVERFARADIEVNDMEKQLGLPEELL